MKSYIALVTVQYVKPVSYHTKCENFAIMIVAIQLIGSDGFLTTHGGDTGYCTRVPGTVL